MSVLGDILTAVEATLEGLSLSGIAADDIDVLKKPLNPPATSTGAWVYPADINPQNATNLRDDIVYTVWIVPFQKSNLSETSNQERAQLWRQQIQRAFHNKRLSSSGGTVLAWVCKLDPSEVFPLNALLANYDAIPMALKCWSREARS